MAKKLNRAVIKEEFYELTGHPLKALIINQFLYWTERVNDYDQFIKEEKKRARREGSELTLEETKGWIYKKADELKEELMVHWHVKTIRNHIKALVEKGYLAERQNPKQKFDNTKQYRVDILKINRDLMEMGYVLQGYKFDDLIQDEMKKAIRQTNSGLEGNTSDSKGNEFDAERNEVGSKRNEVSPERNDFGSEGNQCASDGTDCGTIPETTYRDYNTETKREEEKEARAKDLDKQTKGAIEELYQKVFDEKISDFQLETLESYLADNDGLEYDVIILALQEAGLANAKSFRYVIITLDDWLKRELKTADQVMKMKESRSESSSSKKGSKSTGKSNSCKVRGTNNYEPFDDQKQRCEMPKELVKQQLKEHGLIKIDKGPPDREQSS